jgi:hypothetical protein
MRVTVAELQLQAVEFSDLSRWRWVLTDASGAFVADHEVRLDVADWRFEAFADLAGYLSWHLAPDQRAAGSAKVVGDVGSWAGRHVLGRVGEDLVRHARRGPMTVRVVVPPEGAELLYRPLELAHVGGRPLAAQDVTLVMATGSETARAAVGERLRVLGLFSMPEGNRSLNLRRERSALVRLGNQARAGGKAVEVRVLQYGATRKRLHAVLSEAEGWDIVHVSGHGMPGELLLETPSGRPDRVGADELAALLSLAGDRVKLVTVATCWSAAAAVAEQRGLLALAGEDTGSAEQAGGSSAASASGRGLADALTEQLGCAVLAMRYPVDDAFAEALTTNLYDLLVRQGRALPDAVGTTLRQLAPEPGSSALPVATPALFGGSAVNLRMAASDRTGTDGSENAEPKLAGFPPEPSRFVGRTRIMALAGAMMGAASGTTGVLLQGMPGGGKSACALELAYGHQDSFERLAWYKAPDEGTETGGALTDFALTLDRALEGLGMVTALASAARLAAFLPRLAELMERQRVLVVIDNLESLLTGGGAWRDGSWSLVAEALTGHGGLGRVIFTSRRMPAAWAEGPVPGKVHVAAVDALPADEALLLARELPHLQALSRGEVAGIGRTEARQLARRVQELAQGHPKLLELADGQASQPGRLSELLGAGDRAWARRGGIPGGFFGTGQNRRCLLGRSLPSCLRGSRRQARRHGAAGAGGPGRRPVPAPAGQL